MSISLDVIENNIKSQLKNSKIRIIQMFANNSPYQCHSACQAARVSCLLVGLNLVLFEKCSVAAVTVNVLRLSRVQKRTLIHVIGNIL